MKLDKKIIIGIVVAIVLIFIILRFYRKSNYVYPESNTVVLGLTSYATFNQNVQKCLDDYNVAGTTGLTAYNTCLYSNVNAFQSNTCPAVLSYLSSNTTCLTTKTTANVTRNCELTDGGTKWSTVSDDLTLTDLPNIKSAYADMLQRAGTVQQVMTIGAGATLVTLTYPSTALIQAARKADVRGPTRRYLARLCPSFYTSNVGGNVVDPTNTYKGFSTSVTTGSYYFSDTLDANSTTASSTPGKSAVDRLLLWAKYAGANGDDVGNPPTAGYTSASDLGTAAASIFSSNYTGTTIPNWVIAMNFGPGTTLTTSVPITWTTATTTTTVTFTPPSSGIIFA